MKWVTRWLLIGGLLLSACSLVSDGENAPGTSEVSATSGSKITTAVEPTQRGDAVTEVQATTQPEVATDVVPATSGAEEMATPYPSATPTPSTVDVLPDPASAAWEVIVRGLERPVGAVDAADGSGRLFILEQTGQIRIWQAGSLLPEPFLDLRGTVACCGERGLLGLAFHPDYRNNGYFYINYTLESRGNLLTQIARYQVSTDADRADPQSEHTLLEIQQPYENHNGGGLAFGPDGHLFIAVGDGGSGGDPLGSGQSRDTLLGKLLRIDVDGGDPYAIPTDNPFAGGGGLPEIWAYGLRNPWRFAFDRLTGDLYIGDVGQGDWEEIDFLPAGYPGGANLGWNVYEGMHPYSGAPGPGEVLVFPVAEYGHDTGQSVTGGAVYRGTTLPDWYGVYLYGDFSSGKVWGLLRLPDGSWQNSLLFETGALISSFGQDASGEVYLVNYNGELLRLVSR
jgi:glucose/arabinose dehydrogenase